MAQGRRAARRAARRDWFEPAQVGFVVIAVAGAGLVGGVRVRLSRLETTA
ncbi:hypothetical protein LQF12_01700 [Ruania suaedae]|nr:hypothetical protein [Ruania suaedae]UFU03352.1 hypothetical protein LQF12_01700 [Ruania suaedae]